MGAGGFRCGAGRRGWRRTTADFLGLDVRALARRGNLRPGLCLNWYWSFGDKPVGSVGVRAGNDHLRLTYTWTPRGAPERPIDCRVSIEKTRCNLGGSRPWFRCPRCDCRRAVLYGPASDGRFGCRGCLRLAYSSEAESKWSRAVRKFHKLGAKLGERGAKPKRMRWCTYGRTLSRIARASEAWQALGRAKAAALSKRRA
jgi:hypothetical protein